MTETVKVVLRGFGGMFLSLFASFVVWAYGIGRGELFDLQSAGCDDGPSRLTRITENFFLPSSVCHYADGSTRQLVPSFVVPLSLLFLLGAVLSIVAMVRTLDRRELWR